MTEKEYRASEGISRSELWRLRESPEKFKYLQDHPEEPTPALIFGAMVHKLVLEPEDFENEYAVAPEVDRRTKDGKAAWQEFVDGAGDKTVVTVADYEKAKEMAAKVADTPLVADLLDGEHEMPLFWSDEATGEVCKVRLDCFTTIEGKNVVVDYKTSSDASTAAFMRSAINYGYDFQAGMYTEAVEQNLGQPAAFIFIVQEKTAPYSVNILEASPDFIQRGRDIFRELIGIYHECKTTGNWYGYLGAYGVMNELQLPAWLADKSEEKPDESNLDEII